MTRDQKVFRLMARDICSVEDSLSANDFEFICAIMDGTYWTQWVNMSPEGIDREYDDVNWENVLYPDRVEEIFQILLKDLE